MKIGRIQNNSGQTQYIVRDSDGRHFSLNEDPLECLLDDRKPEVGSLIDAPYRWLSPIKPAAIIGIGMNYRRHALELGFPIPEEPVFFMKNPATATGHLEPIHIPAVCEDEVDYEAELAVVLGRPCRDAKPENAEHYIFGYTVANDVTARKWVLERGGSQWSRGKSFDTFCPLGPYLVTPDEIPDVGNLGISLRINNVAMQSSNTSDMLFGIYEIISFLSQSTTLLPGTVILTGTPEGVGWSRTPRVCLRPGDTCEVWIEKVGTLTNSVLSSG